VAAPDALADFLKNRADAIWRVVSVLEKGTPEWSSGQFDQAGPPPQLLAFLRLDGLLLAFALVEQRAGREIEVRRLLEASWRLYLALSRDSSVLSRIVAVGAMTFQVGVLRKSREPPVEWMDRLGREDAWKMVLDAFEEESRETGPTDPALAQDALSDSFAKVHARAVRAVADGLRRVTPCEAERLSVEEVGRPMAEELRRLKSPGEDAAAIAEIFTGIEIPSLLNRLVRAGRLLVDAELTSKILELRFARTGSRDGRWPDRLPLADSRVCPGAAYEYETNGVSMSISFRGSPPVPPSGLRLPLSFSSGAGGGSTPSPAPARTPTAAPQD
jgi:hypothetical protein